MRCSENWKTLSSFLIWGSAYFDLSTLWCVESPPFCMYLQYSSHLNAPGLPARVCPVWKNSFQEARQSASSSLLSCPPTLSMSCVPQRSGCEEAVERAGAGAQRCLLGASQAESRGLSGMIKEPSIGREQAFMLVVKWLESSKKNAGLDRTLFCLISSKPKKKRKKKVKCPWKYLL